TQCGSAAAAVSSYPERVHASPVRRISALVGVDLELGELRCTLDVVVADVQADVIHGGVGGNGDADDVVACRVARAEQVGRRRDQGGPRRAVGAAVHLDGLVAVAPALREPKDDPVDRGGLGQFQGEHAGGVRRLPVGGLVAV